MYRIAIDKNHLFQDAPYCSGLTWSDLTIDSAYSAVIKLVPTAVIVKL